MTFDKKQYERERADIRFARGLCRQCPNKVTDKRFCSICSKRHIETNRILRLKRIAEGKCPYCPNLIEDKTKKRCNRCLQKRRKRYANRKNATGMYRTFTEKTS